MRAILFSTGRYSRICRLILARTRLVVRPEKCAFSISNLRPVRFEGQTTNNRKVLPLHLYMRLGQSGCCAGITAFPNAEYEIYRVDF